jgi:hypothetical protein
MTITRLDFAPPFSTFTSTPMPPPQPPSNPLVRKSASPSSARPSATSPKIPRPAHQFSWSRPFAFALRPKILLFVVAPTAMLLNYLDPLGTNEKVKEKIESVIPTMESAGAAAETKERVLSRKQEKAIQATMARRQQEGAEHGVGALSAGSQGGGGVVEAVPIEDPTPVPPVSAVPATPVPASSSGTTGSNWSWGGWFGKDPSTPLHHQSPSSPLPPTNEPSPPPLPSATPAHQANQGKTKTALDGLL